eukprot:15388497-Heterocapsa_arctica.AAC.1
MNSLFVQFAFTFYSGRCSLCIDRPSVVAQVLVVAVDEQGYPSPSLAVQRQVLNKVASNTCILIVSYIVVDAASFTSHPG